MEIIPEFPVIIKNKANDVVASYLFYDYMKNPFALH